MKKPNISKQTISPKMKLIMFLILVVIQLVVPLYSMYTKNLTLRFGESVKFKIAPVDPYDAFRGRSVYINIAENKVKGDPKEDYVYGHKVYISVKKDTDGYATLEKASLAPPVTGTYFSARVNYQDKSSGEAYININLPFNTYYLPEELAPIADTAYNDALRNKKVDAYVTVSIFRGDAVIKEMYLDNKPVLDYLKEYIAENHLNGT